MAKVVKLRPALKPGIYLTKWQAGEVPADSEVELTYVTRHNKAVFYYGTQRFTVNVASWTEWTKPAVTNYSQPAEVIRITDDPRFWRNLNQTPGEKLLRANMANYRRRQAKQTADRSQRNKGVR